MELYSVIYPDTSSSYVTRRAKKFARAGVQSRKRYAQVDMDLQGNATFTIKDERGEIIYRRTVPSTYTGEEVKE